MRWLPVVGFEDLYQISNTGLVQTIKNGHLKTPQILRYGHHAVLLWKGNKPKMMKVHRMVLFAFVGPPPRGHQCRHLDGNAANNCVENLAWGTQTQNQKDRATHGTSNRGERCATAKLTEAQVRQILDDPRPQKEIAAQYGVRANTISRIKSGVRWAHISH